jgi:uncharacterized membrane protein
MFHRLFDTIDGIPLHPLFVHAPVVLIPLTLGLGLVYVFLPPLRRRVDWALFVLAAAGPASAFAATQSGEQLRRHLDPTTTNPVISVHQQFGENLRNVSALLFLVVAALIFSDRLRIRRKRRGTVPGPEGSATLRGGGGLWTVLGLVFALAFLGIGGLTGYYVFKAGDTGAHMSWDGKIK